MAKRGVAKGVRVAIVGAASLRGKEVKELLEASALPVEKLTLLDDTEALGHLTDYDGEPALVQRIEPGVFHSGEVVFFASTRPDFTRQHWRRASEAGALVIDLSHALLDEPGTQVRAGLLLNQAAPGAARWLISPHPAVLVLLSLLVPLEKRFGLVRAVANVFEPVSECGAAAMDELREQTVHLLSFQDVPETFFDAQIAFNLLAGYGGRSPVRLEETEAVVAGELNGCARELAARTTLRLLQAPVFHGLGVSLWVDLERPPEPSAVEEALRSARVRVHTRDEPVPAVTDSAGCDEILLGPIVRDRSRASALWLWAVADNLRLAARNAVELAESLVR